MLSFAVNVLKNFSHVFIIIVRVLNNNKPLLDLNYAQFAPCQSSSSLNCCSWTMIIAAASHITFHAYSFFSIQLAMVWSCATVQTYPQFLTNRKGNLGHTKKTCSTSSITPHSGHKGDSIILNPYRYRSMTFQELRQVVIHLTLLSVQALLYNGDQLMCSPALFCWFHRFCHPTKILPQQLYCCLRVRPTACGVHLP